MAKETATPAPAETKAEKKPEKKAPAESVYTVSELAGNARSVFGTMQECVVAALKTDGKADFDLQLSPVHRRHVDDGVVRQIGVRDHNGTVVDAVDCRVIHLNLLNRSLLAFAREDDVVTDLKWLQQQNHHPACKV